MRASNIKSADKYYGRKIVHASFSEDEVKLIFEDGVRIEIFDDGQQCCENRYMRTDDDVQCLIGKSLVSMTVKNVEATDCDRGTHEIAFLEIQAGHETFVISTHNEHNGYYSGFSLSIKER